MYALITDGSIAKYLSGNRGITIGGIQYPQNIFTVWTAAEKEAIGIYEVIQNNTKKKDGEYYINTNQTFTYDADAGTVTATYGDATAKAHADTTWTQDQIDAGDAPAGADTDTVAVEGLKTIRIENILNLCGIVHLAESKTN